MAAIIDDRQPRVVVVERASAVIAVSSASRAVTVASPGPQGPQGPAGEGSGGAGGSLSLVASATVSQYQVVRSTSATSAAPATNANPTHGDDVLGVAMAAAGVGESFEIRTQSTISNPSWNWAPLLPIFLGADGAMTQVPPAAPAAAFSLQVGHSMSATQILVWLGTPLYFTLTPPSEGGGGGSES